MKFPFKADTAMDHSDRVRDKHFVELVCVERQNVEFPDVLEFNETSFLGLSSSFAWNLIRHSALIVSGYLNSKTLFCHNPAVELVVGMGYP